MISINQVAFSWIVNNKQSSRRQYTKNRLVLINNFKIHLPSSNY